MGGVRRALVVGVDAYDDPALTRLRSPAHDAEALAEVLGDPEIGGFDVVRSYNPTERALSETVEGFFCDADREDLLLLHLSCHGVKDAAGELYFAASDTTLTRLRSTGVSAAFVSAVMADSRARRTVLLLDCCYSGAFERGMTHRSGQDVDLGDRFADARPGRGRAVLTASSAMEYAFEEGDLTDETSLGPSVFTRAVVEGLRTGEADRDQDGSVDLDELYEFVLDRVRRSTTRQTPHMWVYGLEGRLSLARRKTPVTVPAPLPAEVRQALDNPLSGVRLSVVPHLVELAQGSHLGLALGARLALQRLTTDDSKRVEAAAERALAELPAASAGPTPVPPEPEHPVPPEPEPQPQPEPEPDRQSGPTPPPGLPRRLSRTATLSVAGAAVVVAGLALAAQHVGDGDDRLTGASGGTSASPTASPTPTPTATAVPAPVPPPVAAPAALQWAGAAPPAPHEEAVLAEVRRSFADTGVCRDESGPDPRDVVPSEVDNVVCSYPSGMTVVFSRFASDAAMEEFFALRLVGRELTELQGELGPVPPWHVRLPADRPGRAYGNLNRKAAFDPVRAEIGTIRDGTRTYAYAYAPGTDFAGLYAAWSETFL